MRAKRGVLLAIWVGFFGILAMVPKANALSSDGAVYPESNFGAPPSQPDLGLRPNRPNPFVMEEDQVPQNGSGRSPASVAESRPLHKPDEKGAVQEVSLIAGDLGYFPSTVVVAPGIPVRLFLTGASKKALCFMMDPFQIRRQVRTQRIEEVSFTPKEPGKFRFYCPVNGMEGTLLVKEPSVWKAQRKED